MTRFATYGHYIVPILIALVVIGASSLAVWRWSDDLVQRTLQKHAEVSAITWRAELTQSVTGVSDLFSPGAVTAEQRRLVAASMAGSDIFRFEAFDPGGRLTFVSDAAEFAAEQDEALNAAARAVARSGTMVVDVEDGRDNPARPPWYVEAYMPVFAPNGAVEGVIEVYVNVAGLAATLKEKFGTLSILLIGFMSGLYLIPTLLLIRRSVQLRERDRQMLRLSRRDPLTGLFNRAAFNETLARRFDANSGHREPVGILFVDLDKFKYINDSLGHDVGDRLLKHVAGILAQCVGSKDMVARLGGDEFVILSPGADVAHLTALGHRVLTASGAPLPHCETTVHASFSIGAHVSTGNETQRRAMHCADLALYSAKAKGRGRVVVFTEALESEDRRRRLVAEDVRRGLAKDLFFLEFQPIYDRRKQVAGFEALLRLEGSDGARISPEEFIPIAEDAGLIVDLGRWVLRTAIEVACHWPAHTFVAVNVSARQFRTGTLVSDVRSALSLAGLAPDRVCLELTERVLVDDDNNTVEQLAQIKGLGVQIAIDDFGTGYSSLSYLWRYEFNKLKIDRSFFEAYDFDKSRYAKLFETIVVLGHQLDMTVIVEGIEKEEQLAFMMQTDCDYFQGFLLGRPVSRQDADALSRDAAA